MYYGTFLCLATLALPALSAPLTARATESWSIPTMDVHLMGRDTGIPGNTWPENRKFNTTLDFALILPSSERKCSANWIYQQVPTTEQTCGDNVSFQLSPTPMGGFSDATWTLSIRKSDVDAVSGTVTTFAASQVIISNDVGNPDSYLSCLGGPPYDGIRCKLNGWTGVKGPIPLDATSH